MIENIDELTLSKRDKKNLVKKLVNEYENNKKMTKVKETRRINKTQFNHMVSNILALYSKFIGIPENEIAQKMIQFNNQLEKQIKDAELVQLGQDDQTTEKSI